MSEDFTEEDERDYFNPGGHSSTATEDSPNGQLFDDEDVPRPQFSYQAIMDAQDFSTLVRGGSRSRQAKDYEGKVRSILKSGAVGALKHNQLADAATIFHHGPSFSEAAGDMADVSESTRKMIDFITAPENPYVMFAIAAVPFVAQLFRNHQPEIHQVAVTRRQMKAYRKQHPEEFPKAQPKKNVTVHLPFGRAINFRVGVRFNPLRGASLAFHTRTREPQDLVTMVFSDQKLVAALKKQDINIVQTKV